MHNLHQVDRALPPVGREPSPHLTNLLTPSVYIIVWVHMHVFNSRPCSNKAKIVLFGHLFITMVAPNFAQMLSLWRRVQHELNK